MGRGQKGYEYDVVALKICVCPFGVFARISFRTFGLGSVHFIQRGHRGKDCILFSGQTEGKRKRKKEIGVDKRRPFC